MLYITKYKIFQEVNIYINKIFDNLYKMINILMKKISSSNFLKEMFLLKFLVNIYNKYINKKYL